MSFKEMEVNKSDIEKLDFILDKMIETDWLVTANELHLKGYYDEYKDDINLIEKDFKYLLSIFSDIGIGIVSMTADAEMVSPNDRAIIFYKNGGFKKYFADLKTSEENKIVELEKENDRQKLKDRIDQLKHDELKYQKTIRGLKEQLMISSLLKNWWWLITAAIGLGITIGGFLF